MTDKAIQFQTEFEALIRKYKPDIEFDYDIYEGGVDTLHFTIGETIVVSKPLWGGGGWDFGRGVENI